MTLLSRNPIEDIDPGNDLDRAVHRNMDKCRIGASVFDDVRYFRLRID